MRSVLSPLARVAAFIAAVATVLMMVHVTVAVFMRVGFNEPLLGTIEVVSYFYMVAAVFLGIFTAAWQNAHIRVDVLANLLPARVRRVTYLLAEMITPAFFLCFGWGLWRTALTKTRQGEFKCVDWNQKCGCRHAPPGGRCMNGVHVCMKCGEAGHGAHECKKR